jgi:hypothetical protein
MAKIFQKIMILGGLRYEMTTGKPFICMPVVVFCRCEKRSFEDWFSSLSSSLRSRSDSRRQEIVHYHQVLDIRVCREQHLRTVGRPTGH